MDILKRSLAPVTEAAWKEIEEGARDILSSYLSARKIVDVEGPHGWDFPGLPLGRLQLPKKQPSQGVEFGVPQIQPLMEARAPFELDIWELDNLTRGAKDVDLDPMEEAAKNLARFEEKAIYYGLKEGSINGMAEASPHDPLVHNGDSGKLLEQVSLGITRFIESGVEGPYSIVGGPEFWRSLSNCGMGYPVRKQIESLLEGPVILSPFVDGAFLLSRRGGDMRLVLGHDISIGYNSHTKDKVKLYFTESFTFQIIDPAVIIRIDWKKSKK